METATELANSNEIVTQRTAYAPAPEFADPLPDDDKVHIDDLLAGFSNMLGGKFTFFDNLELYGTALYCLCALQKNKMTWTEKL